MSVPSTTVGITLGWAMPVPAALLDLAVDPVVHDVDLRWTMAYAAALGDHNDRYFDTMQPDVVVAHPAAVTRDDRIGGPESVSRR